MSRPPQIASLKHDAQDSGRIARHDNPIGRQAWIGARRSGGSHLVADGAALRKCALTESRGVNRGRETF
jgi:hypothetical protein